MNTSYTFEYDKGTFHRILTTPYDESQYGYDFKFFTTKAGSTKGEVIRDYYNSITQGVWTQPVGSRLWIYYITKYQHRRHYSFTVARQVLNVRYDDQGLNLSGQMVSSAQNPEDWPDISGVLHCVRDHVALSFGVQGILSYLETLADDRDVPRVAVATKTSPHATPF